MAKNWVPTVSGFGGGAMPSNQTTPAKRKQFMQDKLVGKEIREQRDKAISLIPELFAANKDKVNQRRRERNMVAIDSLNQLQAYEAVELLLDRPRKINDLADTKLFGYLIILDVDELTSKIERELGFKEYEKFELAWKKFIKAHGGLATPPKKVSQFALFEEEEDDDRKTNYYD